jgi:hypothetical protein
VRGDSGYEDVKVKFEQPFTSKDSRGGKGIPLVCLGTTEHAVYAMRSVAPMPKCVLIPRRWPHIVDALMKRCRKNDVIRDFCTRRNPPYCL